MFELNECDCPTTNLVEAEKTIATLRERLAATERERDEAKAWAVREGVLKEKAIYKCSDYRAQIKEAKRERDEWKQRYVKTKTIVANLSDKYNGEPCAEIRWQQEREDLRATIAAQSAALGKRAKP